MNLKWQRFDNFFRLYDALREEPRLFYIIGEKHHCYIGSVGGRGGQRGLKSRYQKQYVDRAKAIFGNNEPDNQPAFASIVDDSVISISDIQKIERQIQEAFLTFRGRDNALFTPKGEVPNYKLTHTGEPPDFLLVSP